MYHPQLVIATDKRGYPHNITEVLLMSAHNNVFVEK